MSGTDLAGKVAVVTGGSAGIGAASMRALAEAGPRGHGLRVLHLPASTGSRIIVDGGRML